MFTWRFRKRSVNTILAAKSRFLGVSATVVVCNLPQYKELDKTDFDRNLKPCLHARGVHQTSIVIPKQVCPRQQVTNKNIISPESTTESEIPTYQLDILTGNPSHGSTRHIKSSQITLLTTIWKHNNTGKYISNNHSLHCFCFTAKQNYHNRKRSKILTKLQPHTHNRTIIINSKQRI